VAGRKLDAEELEAGAAAAAVLGGTAVPTDVDGAEDMTHDFDILCPGGRRIALEITSTRDETVLGLLDVAFGRTWTAPGLANDWQVVVPHPVGHSSVRMDRVMREVVPIVAVFESHGLHGANDTDAAPWRSSAGDAVVVSAIRRMEALGVLALREFAPRPSSREAELYATVRHGFGADVDTVNRFVEIHANANAAKLLTADADERHIFVLVDPSSPEAQLAMSTGPPPTSMPVLPAGLDVAWAATRGSIAIGEVGITRLWRVRPPDAWEDIEPPPSSPGRLARST
jgi:hypothetical protein